MSIPPRLTSVLSGVAAFALLAGCSGAAGMPGSQQLSPQGMTYGMGALVSRRTAIPPSKLQPIRTGAEPVKAFVSPAIKAAGTKRFFSDYIHNAVYIYGRGHRIAALKGFTNPSGLRPTRPVISTSRTKAPPTSWNTPCRIPGHRRH